MNARCNVLRLGLLVLAALLVVATDAGAQTLMRLQVDGTDRTLKLDGIRDGAPPRPLVIVLHGWSGSADVLTRTSGWKEIADREDIVVAYLDGHARTWNYGSTLGKAEVLPLVGGKPVDDLAFIRAVIARLVDRNQVDRTRVYLTGVSYGGMMTFAAACAMGRELAAVAPLITGMSAQQRDTCQVAVPMPLLLLAGTNDTIQPYLGENIGATPLLSVDDTVAFWRAHNACKSQTEAPIAHRDASDLTRVSVVTSDGCHVGGAVVLYRVDGGVHTVPSLLPPHRDGRNRDIETAEVVWAFFKRFTRVRD